MPRTKQVATKSSGKGKNVEQSSSSMPLGDATKYLKKRSLLAERGFSFVNPNAEFLATVAALGWEKFVIHRKEYIAPLVRDFYGGIVERNDGKPATVSNCRGAEVNFDPRTINDHYGLGYFGKAIENKQLKYGLAEMNEVKARICNEEAVWEKSGEKGNEFKIATKYLCDEANLWFRFVRHSLLPTGHTLFVDKERLLVIDAIMARDKVEVGKLINREMNKWQNRVDGNLYFPCFITDLCMEAGCEIETGELREQPSGAFDTKFKPRKRPGNASTSVDSQTLQRLVKQQNSLVKFVNEQFEWQKKVAAHVTRGKMITPEPVLPDWMKEIVEEEEDEEDRVPLSAMHLKVVKKEKAKRVRSPAKKKQSPAKKKQKKSSSEEEFRSSDLDLISDPSDENETAKVAEEVSSEEEEEGTESEGEGSSGEKTDTQLESPPTKETTVHPSKSAAPKPPPTQPTPPQPSPEKQPTIDQTVPETPQSTIPETIIPQPPPTQPNSPQKDQPRTINEPEPEPEPTKEPTLPSAQEEPPVDPQPQPTQETQGPNVVASEATTKGAEIVKKPKMRVKHIMTQSPFKRKKRGGSVTTEGGPAESMETEGEVQQPEQAEVQRQKLEVRKKQKADKDKPATATSGAFIATRSASVAVSTGTLAGSSDAVASNVPEVEKAPSHPVVTKEDSNAELLKKKALEEAKQRLAEHIAKDAQDAPPAPSVNIKAAAASESTKVAEEEEAEKKKEKKKKKKGEQTSQLPPRQSGRLRSGALQK